jgi:hypothetical protein
MKQHVLTAIEMAGKNGVTVIIRISSQRRFAITPTLKNKADSYSFNTMLASCDPDRNTQHQGSNKINKSLKCFCC